MAEKVGVIAVSPGPLAKEAVISTALRAIEEYDISKLILIGLERSEEFVKEIEVLIKSLMSIEVEHKLVCDWTRRTEGCSTELEIRRIIVELCNTYGDENVVIVYSPGSRRLAAATALAGVSPSEKDTVVTSACSSEVVHVDFLFGPWSGAPYPYVPRPLEPLIRVYPIISKLPEPNVEVISRLPTLLGDRGCRLPTGSRVPPLRCSVLELARRINIASGYLARNVLDPNYGRLGSCGSFRLEVNSEILGRNVVLEVKDFCNTEEFKQRVVSFSGDICNFLEMLEERISKFDEGFGMRRSSLRQILYLSGLVPPRIVKVEGVKDPEQFIGRSLLHLAKGSMPVIPDTNLVYSGIHIDMHSGLKVRLPYCVVYEVMARYAETSKRVEAPSTALETATYYALIDLMEGGAEIIPSPVARNCEALIPTIDPLLLRRTVIATRDIGAFNLWRLHPSTGGEEVITVLLDSPSCNEAAHRTENLNVSEIYYAILQLAVILRILAHSKVRLVGEERSVVKVNIKINNKSVQVQPPPRRWLH